MKKLSLCLMTLLCFMAVSARKGSGTFADEFRLNSFKGSSGAITVWITLGGRADINNTWLMNKNRMNDKNIKYQFSGGGSGGLMLGLHLSEVFAINGEFLYASYSQKFKSGIDSIDWTSKTTLGYLEVPVLLHFDFNNFKFLELGVKFGMLNSGRYRYNSDLGDLDTDVKNNFGSNTAIVFGWGTGVWGSGGFLLSGGLRLTYGIADIVSDIGGRGTSYISAEGVKSYQPTNTATVGFHLNLDFDLGWFTKSNCGRNYKFTLFGH